MFVEVDKEIRVEDLLRGIIVQSGNDACIVIAENIAGTEESILKQKKGHLNTLKMLYPMDLRI